MRELKNVKVKKKLNFLTQVLIASNLLIGFVGVLGLAFLNGKVSEITDDWIPSMELAQQLDTLTSDYRIKQYGLIVATDKSEIEKYEKEMEQINDEINTSAQEYQGRISSEEETKIFEAADKAWKSYTGQSVEAMEAGKNNDMETAGTLMVGEMRESYDSFGQQMTNMLEYNKTGVQEASRVAKITFYSVIAEVATFIIISIMIGFRLSGKIVNYIVPPLKMAENAMSEMVKGNLNVKLDYESGDEIGSLLGKSRIFVDTLGRIIQDEKYLLGEMAGGNFNLHTRVEELYVGDFQTILLSMRKINRSLGEALSDIAESSGQVNAAAEQTAISAQDLANGASEQASTVEELYAAVQEASSQAEEASGQAEKASNTADAVAAEARGGNQSMGKLVSAMDRINETSKQISSIISTIDGIAAQTNLLSLNASIEAARAGEAGKGFAVVAGEIGQLAAQSSQAANDTKELIETAIEQVEHGNAIAGQTAEVLNRVTERISQVAKAADEVKGMCDTQAAAMQQIDEGIGIIAKVVESNSAAAQESSATSEELSSHAERLNAKLSEFKFKKHK